MKRFFVRLFVFPNPGSYRNWFVRSSEAWHGGTINPSSWEAEADIYDFQPDVHRKPHISKQERALKNGSESGTAEAPLEFEHMLRGAGEIQYLRDQQDLRGCACWSYKIRCGSV